MIWTGTGLLTNKKGVWQRLREAISSIRKYDKVDMLRQRLDSLRQQLMVEIFVGMQDVKCFSI